MEPLSCDNTPPEKRAWVTPDIIVITEILGGPLVTFSDIPSPCRLQQLDGNH